MHILFANTIWAPIFVYRYNTPSALLTFAIGFVAECGVFHLYTRSSLPFGATVKQLAVANVVSYIAGNIILIFLIMVPVDIHKDNLLETGSAFLVAYLLTIPIEFCVMRSSLPTNWRLVFRAVVMSNFVSYSILFLGYIFWIVNWRFIVYTWFGHR